MRLVLTSHGYARVGASGTPRVINKRKCVVRKKNDKKKNTVTRANYTDDTFSYALLSSYNNKTYN